MTFWGDKDIADWVKILLWSLNGITTIITICNVLYLYHTFPKVRDVPSKQSLESSISAMSPQSHHRFVHGQVTSGDISALTRSNLAPSNDPHDDLLCDHEFDHEESRSMVRPQRTERSDSFFRRQSLYRSGIQKYFYVVSVIPCCVSYAGHYGARFPEDALWIFPGMNIAIGIGFLAFIRMMVMSCEGWQEIRRALSDKDDECESLRGRPIYRKCCRRFCCKPLFLRENAYEGLKQRILICCLILLKPLVNYIEAVFEIDYHSNNTKDQRIIAYTLRTLTMCTTFIPLNAMRSFHATLLPYTRLRRTGIKRALVAVLAPVCQLQEVFVQFAWGHWKVPGFEGVPDQFRWCCAYGIILVIEMTFISCIISFVAYRPKDLRLWEYSESFLRKHGYKNHMKDEDFLFGKTGIIDNIEEAVVPEESYIGGNVVGDHSLNSSVHSMPSRMSNSISGSIVGAVLATKNSKQHRRRITDLRKELIVNE